MFTDARTETLAFEPPAGRWQEAAAARALPLDPARLRAAKRGCVTRCVDLAQIARIITGGRPRAGDLLLARVLEIGHHRRIELPSGRKAQLFEGDELLLAYGARYASDQFAAVVPEDLAPCDLVAAGGLAGRCTSRHERTRRPTRIAPVGLLADARGRVLALRDFAPLGRQGEGRGEATPPFTLAVVGTAMNAGKTTTAAALVRGYRRLGRRVAALKATGTGSGGDRFALLDAGAAPVFDFTDLGFASTCRLPGAELEAIFTRLLAAAAAAGAEVAVVEIADGLLFEDTARLVGSAAFRRRVDALVLAAADALGAAGSVHWLRDHGLAPALVSGALTASPLAVREAEGALALPVVPPAVLAAGLQLPSCGR